MLFWQKKNTMNARYATQSTEFKAYSLHLFSSMPLFLLRHSEFVYCLTYAGFSGLAYIGPVILSLWLRFDIYLWKVLENEPFHLILLSIFSALLSYSFVWHGYFRTCTNNFDAAIHLTYHQLIICIETFKRVKFSHKSME